MRNPEFHDVPRGSHPAGQGFTHLELPAVMVIIGLLAEFAGTKYFSNIVKSQAKAARARLDGPGKTPGRRDRWFYLFGATAATVIIGAIFVAIGKAWHMAPKRENGQGCLPAAGADGCLLKSDAQDELNAAVCYVPSGKNYLNSGMLAANGFPCVEISLVAA